MTALATRSQPWPPLRRAFGWALRLKLNGGGLGWVERVVLCLAALLVLMLVTDPPRTPRVAGQAAPISPYRSSSRFRTVEKASMM